MEVEEVKEILAKLPKKDKALADLAYQIVRLRQALGYFINDPRFTVTVGGNPSVVQTMVERVRQVYKDTRP